MNRALEVFFCALVSDTLSLENQYVSYLLSIDCLRHPLFTGTTTCLPSRNQASGDYEFATQQFTELRLPLIRGNFWSLSLQYYIDRLAVIFDNVERHLNHQDGSNIETKSAYVDACHKMFSRMRRVRSVSELPLTLEPFKLTLMIY